MNRRSLLRTLATLAVSGSSVASLAAIHSEAAERPQTLQDLLARSHRDCQQLCHVHASATTPGLSSSAQELSALIEQAMLRLNGSHPVSAAFWQSCSDAFVRTVRQLEPMKSHASGLLTRIDDIQRTFRSTTESLNEQTATSIILAGC